MTYSASLKNKLNAYTGYVVPILSYCFQAWLQNRQQMRKLKSYKKSISWILSGRNCTYNEKLIALKVLPLSVNVEMHDLLFLLSLLDNKFNLTVNFEYQDFEKTRQNTRGVSKKQKIVSGKPMKTSFTEPNYFTTSFPKFLLFQHNYRAKKL